MVLIDGIKYACERCIRGHRVSTCTHTDVQLIPIKPKGRPTSQCVHCREARKARALHTKCLCGASTSGKTHSHAPSCPCAIDPNQCTCLKNKRTRSVSTSSRRSSKGNTPPLSIKRNDSHVSLPSSSSNPVPPLFIPDQLPQRNQQIPLIISTNSDNSPYFSQPSSYASPSPINSSANSFISLAHQPSVSNHQLSPLSPMAKNDDASTIPQSDSDAYVDDDGWLALTAIATITAHNYSHPSSTASLPVSPQVTGDRPPSTKSFNDESRKLHGYAELQAQSQLRSHSETHLQHVPSLPQVVTSNAMSDTNATNNSISNSFEQSYNESDEMFIALSSFDTLISEDTQPNDNKKTNTQLWLDILAPDSNDNFDWSAISEASIKSEVALPSESGLSSTFDDATPQTTSYLYNNAFLPRNYEDQQHYEHPDRPLSIVNSQTKPIVTSSETKAHLPDMWNYFAEQ